jgi:triacylglycerol lipase
MMPSQCMPTSLLRALSRRALSWRALSRRALSWRALSRRALSWRALSRRAMSRRSLYVLAVATCATWLGSGCAAPPDGEAAPTTGDPPELVVLVHGMGRTPLSMVLMERDLEDSGYRVLNWGYSSYCCSIAELGDQLLEAVTAYAGDAERVHFVGHSLGNIIIRTALAAQVPPSRPATGRFVMLAPPNQGSHSADRHARWLGDVLKPLPELTTDPASTVRRLPVPAGMQVGIIAGEYDGKVTVAETRLDGSEEHVSVPAAHTFLMARGDVRGLVLRFLRSGTFVPADSMVGVIAPTAAASASMVGVSTPTVGASASRDAAAPHARGRTAAPRPDSR